MAPRAAWVAAVADRHARPERTEGGRIVDACVAVTGHQREHAMRLLRGGKAGCDRQGQRRGRLDDGGEARGVERAVGGVGPGPRQAAAAAGAGGGDRAARTSTAGARGTHQRAGDARDHDRPGAAGGAGPCRRQEAPAHAPIGGGAAERGRNGGPGGRCGTACTDGADAAGIPGGATHGWAAGRRAPDGEAEAAGKAVAKAP